MDQPHFSPYAGKLDEPWEQLAGDRERCPVAYSKHLGAVQISSYAGVREFLGRTDGYSGVYTTLWPLDVPLAADDQVFSAADPPRHTRQRKLFVKAMSASRISTMRPFSERLINALVDAIIAGGETFDLATAYAWPITEGHVSQLLGIPESERARFTYLSGRFERSTATRDHTFVAEMAEWAAQLARMVRRRRAAGEVDDDLITRLCFAEEDGDRLATAEVSSLIRAMIQAGNTTTAATIGNTVHALETHPEQKARYLADIDGLTGPLIQEALRYDGPILGLWRRCTRDATVEGHPLAAGDRVFTVTAAANHDPQVFERPDEFDITRTAPERQNPHLSFGHGIHHCIGMNLALLECEVGLATLYRRLPGLRLADGPRPVQVPGPVARGWLGIRMTYDRDRLR